MYKLACPKCHSPLAQENNSYLCDNHHCYDIAKSTYINLLLNPDKATTNPGDSKESLVARKAFLNKGYYDVIASSVIETIQTSAKENMHILDVGCGEGYYLHKAKQTLGNTHTYYGLDISKEAISMATKYTKDICWMVGNSKNIPIIDHSIDYVLALFTVINQEELKRVLHEDGYIIHVTANPNHLIEIKKLIYEEIKIKSDKHIRLDFPVVHSFDVIKTIPITNHEDALALLAMTPHYYHIKKERRGILETIKNIDITIDVKFTIYKMQPF